MKKIALMLVIILTLSLCACGKPIDYSITEASEAVENPNVNEPYLDPISGSGYVVLVIGGRSYIGFGRAVRKLDGSMIGPCIAYNKDDMNQRYFSVAGSEDIICSYYVNGIMEQKIFWRALDTIGQDIEVPRFIEPEQEGVWSR